jgi:hypothetical protein
VARNPNPASLSPLFLQTAAAAPHAHPAVRGTGCRHRHGHARAAPQPPHGAVHRQPSAATPCESRWPHEVPRAARAAPATGAAWRCVRSGVLPQGAMLRVGPLAVTACAAGRVGGAAGHVGAPLATASAGARRESHGPPRAPVRRVASGLMRRPFGRGLPRRCLCATTGPLTGAACAQVAHGYIEEGLPWCSLMAVSIFMAILR